MDKYKYAIEYLLNNASEAIKYRVLTELCTAQIPIEVESLKKEIIASERYKKLICCLRNRREYHGATIYAVENALNMLVDMGIYYQNEFDEFDKVLEEISVEASRMPINKNHVLGQLPHIVIVPFFLRAGMREPWMMKFFLDRIQLIHDFVKKKRYDIYEEELGEKNIPESFKNRPIIREELYVDGEICFPLEYDIYACAAVYQEVETNVREQIDDIIEYIMDERYQLIEDGYGILRKHNNYWAMGWDSKPTDLSKYHKYNSLLLKADLLATFPQVISSKWFAKVMELLQQYVDENGIYHFPNEFLIEKNSCWILGCHMGLGENRRKKITLELEGTFRMTVLLNKIDEINLR